MDVILDTNVLYDNYFLDSPRFQALFIYLKKTNSKLVIPAIVLRELKKNYNQQIEKLFKKLESQERILQTGTINLNEDSISTIIRSYEEKLSSIIKAKKIKVTEYLEKPDSLKKIIDKSIQDLPPFHGDDCGLRDSLIWGTVIDNLQKQKNNVGFISNDRVAFGNSTLHDNLVQEVKKTGGHLFYYNELDTFLKEYGEKIQFIDDKLIRDYIQDIEYSLADQYSRSDFEKDELSPRHNYDDIHIDDVDFSGANVSNYYIFEQTKDHYLVNVIGDLEFEVSYDVINLDYDGPSSYSDTDIVTRDFEAMLKIDKSTKKVTEFELL